MKMLKNSVSSVVSFLIALWTYLLVMSGVAVADTAMYPTYGVYSPTKSYTTPPVWTFTKRPKGYLMTISAAMRFDPSVSDYVTCEIPGMEGLAGSEKYRFSVSFNETKTVTFVGFVIGTSVSLNCATEGSKLKPVTLDASMIGVSIDQATKR